MSGRSAFGLVWPGLRCLNLFSGAHGTTEVVPFPNWTLRQSGLPPFFAKNAKKRMGHPLGWYDSGDGQL